MAISSVMTTELGTLSWAVVWPVVSSCISVGCVPSVPTSTAVQGPGLPRGWGVARHLEHRCCVNSGLCLQLQETHFVRRPSSICSCRANTTRPPALWMPGTPTRRQTRKVSCIAPSSRRAAGGLPGDSRDLGEWGRLCSHLKLYQEEIC